MKVIKIEPPSGYEIDKEKSTFENIVFKKIENILPRDISEIKGRDFYIGIDYRTKVSTEKRAKAFIALMQLVELRDAWNEDWKADFSDKDDKYCVHCYRDVSSFTDTVHDHRILCFKTFEIRNDFHKTFKDLIEEAKELL